MIAIFNTILAYKLLMMMINQGTMMHGVINKAYMEKFKPVIDEEGNVYIIANVRVTPAAQKYWPMKNDKILNFLPTTTLKKIKNIEDIPKYSFKFINTDMLSERVNVNMYLSRTSLTLYFFTLFLS